jgi:hypothetical protein
MALERLLPTLIRDEGMALEEDHVNNPQSEFFGKPELFAREKFAFCKCQRCSQVYCGGRVACGDDAGDDPNQWEYLCQGCRSIPVGEICPKHERNWMIYKCFWCCRPATYFRLGTTYFCDHCHSRWCNLREPWPECSGENCIFGSHPPNGTQQKFAICRMCMPEH